MTNLTQLLTRLERDPWRLSNPFSSDVGVACEVLLNPFSRDDERKEAIRGWLTRFQPCVFGQVAAKGDRLFISIIDDALIRAGDKAVRAKLKRDKQMWKQWSLEAKGRHGLLVAILSPRLHYAAPNRALKEFALHIRNVISPKRRADRVGNDMTYEWLYLKNPNTGQFHAFRVILDFFASAGDGRWWHDHRFPGGIAFTFNSLGHMARTKEWYEKNTRPAEWAARLAMMTISNALPHPTHGKATWLLDLSEGRAQKNIGCPFANPEVLPEPLKGKDWTSYQGFHHTDHSVRGEFFDGRENPDRSRGAYILDFSYIGGAGSVENSELMEGVMVDSNVVYKDIGRPEDWRFGKPAAKAARRRPVAEERKIVAALVECRKWLRRRLQQ